MPRPSWGATISRVQRSFSPADVEWVLGGQSGLFTNGTMYWTEQSGSLRSTMPCYCDNGFGPALRLEMQYRIPTAKRWQPTLTLNLGRDCIYRLDVNGNHREKGIPHLNTTHYHVRRKPGGRESFHLDCSDVPAVLPHEGVSGGVYRSILEAFAVRCHLDISLLTWSNPPPEGP